MVTNGSQGIYNVLSGKGTDFTKKQKQSGDPNHKKKYKELKRLVQREIRRANVEIH
jgi:hypothetical protein